MGRVTNEHGDLTEIVIPPELRARAFRDPTRGPLTFADFILNCAEYSHTFYSYVLAVDDDRDASKNNLHGSAVSEFWVNISAFIRRNGKDKAPKALHDAFDHAGYGGVKPDECKQIIDHWDCFSGDCLADIFHAADPDNGQISSY